ncbi:MAG: cysteine--tRNA ligase [Alphaproteobacteria bacterium]|nr:cysteine--tRNA ligase [Alphaproteobacteria bacterium]
MPLKIYDTAQRNVVDFKPIDEQNVRMYVCGPTVYDYIHIGNARPFVIFDVLYRLLRHLYGEAHVKYVRNITDVDDKINDRARKNWDGKSDLTDAIRALTELTNNQFQEDSASIGNLAPDVQPRATEHIQEMQDIISRLIENGHAYAKDGHVLFDTQSWSDYGVFSNKDQEELEVGARVEVAPYKKNPTDFVLWKPSDEETPGWESPWGYGRPGWHIECSAMSEKHLGAEFDIHGGGLDLIFPHHQNEVAQSCCANKGSSFAKHWMHNGYLMSEGEKMSKSLGNFYTVHELLEEFPGEALRLVLLKSQYRSPMNFSKDKLRAAKGELDKFYRLLADSDDASGNDFESKVANEGYDETLLEALLDDLNTPQALTRLHAIYDEGDVVKLKKAASILGILQNDPAAWFKGDASDDEAEEIEALIQKRKDAKAAKDFATADAVRDELTARGIVLEDKPGGITEWRKA